MNSKHAIIDIGSNTIHMDIFSYDKNIRQIEHLDYKTNVNKLGVYLLGDKKIPENKIKELIFILKEFISFAKINKVQDIKIFASSILREAENTKDILFQIKQEINYNIDIISKQKEIDLAFYSVHAVYDLKNKKNLIIDIGGGSTEIIISNGIEQQFSKSFDIGFAKIKKILDINNIFTRKKADEISKYTCDFIINSELNNFKNIDIIIGTSSIFKCLGFILNESSIKLNELKDKTININNLNNILELFLNNNIKIEEDKKDIIFIGIVFLLEFLKKFKLDNILICPWSIREAYFFI